MSELGPIPADWIIPQGYVGVRNDRYAEYVRDADVLRQARELARRWDGEDVSERLRVLLDLLGPVPDTGAEPDSPLNDDEMKAAVALQLQTETRTEDE